MDRQALRGHVLVILATLSGIIGMGLVFGAVMHHNLAQATQGVPLLFIGLWGGRTRSGTEHDGKPGPPGAGSAGGDR